MNTALIVSNLTSPAVLCFIIGSFAALVKSDLRIPAQVHETISMYLLFAIGLKGGIALSNTSLDVIFCPMVATLALAILTPIIAYFVALKLGKINRTNSAALAAHFGSVSAVTFMAAVNFAELSHITYEGFVTALVVVLEIPGIIVALMIYQVLKNRGKEVRLGKVLHETITGKSVILLSGGLLVGLFADRVGIESVSKVFITPFQGVLAFFLLEMGVVAASRLKAIKSSLVFMLLFGTAMPLVFAAFGLIAGTLAGLSPGGTAILATMAASASYIAAPAAVKMALPDADPGLYLTTSISITLPFNIAIGIPLYFSMATGYAF